MIRPERPTLEGDYEEMLRTLLVYTFQLEEYVDITEQYIKTVNELLTKV